MALDTPQKRRAAAGFLRFSASVTPNAAKDAAWRAQAAGGYWIPRETASENDASPEKPGAEGDAS